MLVIFQFYIDFEHGHQALSFELILMPGSFYYF